MLPAGLSMLWERVPAADALTERFGFESIGAAASWCSDTLTDAWGIAVHDVTRLAISSDNAVVWADTDAGRVVVKWSRAREQFSRLAASADLLRMLADRGVPVAQPLAVRGGAARIVRDGPASPLSVAVLPELAGDWLDVADEASVRAAGASLAELHAALATIEPHPAFTNERVDWSTRITGWLAARDRDRDRSTTSAEAVAVGRLSQLLSGAPPLDDAVQLIHNDYRAANVLMLGSRVTGILDFDDVTVTNPVYDLAKASVYLGTLFTDWGPTAPTVRRRFREGYESVRTLGAPEARWLEILTLWLGLHAGLTQPRPHRWLAAL